MEVRIAIEPGSDPIAGVVHLGDPPTPRPFVGWMALVELIRVAASDVGQSPSDRGEAR